MQLFWVSEQTEETVDEFTFLSGFWISGNTAQNGLITSRNFTGKEINDISLSSVENKNSWQQPPGCGPTDHWEADHQITDNSLLTCKTHASKNCPSRPTNGFSPLPHEKNDASKIILGVLNLQQ